MKNKKLFAILTLVCFLFTLMPVAAFAGGTETVVEVTTTEQFKEATTRSGITIKLMNDMKGSGIVIDNDITIDFNDHSYTFTTPAVGSTGTTTNGFQILKGHNVTLQNGTLSVDSAHAGEYYILIQNYANLTLDNMVLDGEYLDRYKDSTGYSYTLSNNCGTIVIKDTEVIANKDGAHPVAFDVCKFGNYELPNVTVEGDSCIYGNIEITNCENLTIKSGTFTDLATAVKYAENGATIKLADDVTGSGIVVDGQRTVTIDLNGKTYTITTPFVGSTGTKTNGMQLLKGSTVTIKNGTLNFEESAKIGIKNYGDLTIDNVVLNSGILNAINNCGTLTVQGNETKITASDNIWAISTGNYGKGDVITTNIYAGEISSVACETPLWETGDATVDESVTTNIYGGTIGKVGVYDWRSNYGDEYQNAPMLTNWKMIISNGKINTLSFTEEDKANVSITGGTFTTDPSAYVADGYDVKKSNDLYTVAKHKTHSYSSTTSSNSVTIDGNSNVTVKVSDKNAKKGDTVTITVDAKDGYYPESVVVKDKNGNEITVTRTGLNEYQFTMPSGKVTVDVDTAACTTELVLQIGNNVVVNNDATVNNDVAPFIQDDRTMVPLRVIVEQLGGVVAWDEDTRTVTLTIDGKVLTMVIDEIIPGFDTAATIVGGRTYVPIRYVMEAIGADVDWIEATRQIVIVK